MDTTTWLWLGTIAVLVSAVGISQRVDPDKRTLFAFLAVIVWAAWGFLAGDLRLYDGGIVYEQAYTTVRYLGWMFGLVMFVYFLQGAMGRLNPRDTNSGAGATVESR